MSSLYEIDRELQELLETGFNETCIDKETGEIDENKVKEYLEKLPIDRTIKLDNYGKLIKNLKSEAEALKAEEDNLKKRREQKEKKIEWLKNSVSLSLQAFGEDKFESSAVVFSFRQSSRIDIQDISKIPPEFMTTKTETSPDKKALTKALKDKKVIEGVSLVITKNLQVN